MVSIMNNDEKAAENLSKTIMLLNCSSIELSIDQRFSVIPSMANRPTIVTGTSAFLRLNISAKRQNTPSADIAINVCIGSTKLSIYMN